MLFGWEAKALISLALCLYVWIARSPGRYGNAAEYHLRSAARAAGNDGRFSSSSVLVDGQPLNPDDLIPAGATLTIRIQEQEITSILDVTGDVTKDRAINASDALSVFQQVVGLISLDQVQSFAADVDRNGQISTVDALLVLQYTVNLIDHF